MIGNCRDFGTKTDKTEKMRHERALIMYQTEVILGTMDDHIKLYGFTDTVNGLVEETMQYVPLL